MFVNKSADNLNNFVRIQKWISSSEKVEQLETCEKAVNNFLALMHHHKVDEFDITYKRVQLTRLLDEKKNILTNQPTLCQLVKNKKAHGKKN